MIVAIDCNHENHKRNGKDRNGNQRFKCCSCGKRWTEKRVRPIGDMRLDLDRAEVVLKLLVEGTSVRSINRVANVTRNTIIELLQQVGERCQRWMESTVRDVPCTDIQADELWSFVGMKERTRQLRGETELYGDCWTFVAIDRVTKLVVAWHMGKRTGWHTREFVTKISKATSGRFQITTDGYNGYSGSVPAILGPRVDYAQLQKIYRTPRDQEERYSPGIIVRTRREVISGNPDLARVCTSHVERQNLNFRMCIRRFTRLTNGFSKRWESHESAMALYIAVYNFCRKHGAHGQTPAMAAGIADHRWTIRELLHATAPQY